MPKIQRGGFVLLVAVVSAGACAGRGPSSGDDDGAFLAGRTINYIVATYPGGISDTYARVFARHFERSLPDTRVVVRNVPGATNLLSAVIFAFLLCRERQSWAFVAPATLALPLVLYTGIEWSFGLYLYRGVFWP